MLAHHVVYRFMYIILCHPEGDMKLKKKKKDMQI